MLPRGVGNQKKTKQREELGNIKNVRRLKDKKMGKSSPPRSKRIFGSKLNTSSNSLNNSLSDLNGNNSEEEEKENTSLRSRSQERQERKTTTDARDTKMKEQAKKLGMQMRGKSGVQTLPVAQLLMDLYTDHNMVRDLVMKNLTGNNISEIVTMVTEAQQVITTLKIGEEEGIKKITLYPDLLKSIYPSPNYGITLF